MSALDDAWVDGLVDALEDVAATVRCANRNRGVEATAAAWEKLLELEGLGAESMPPLGDSDPWLERRLDVPSPEQYMLDREAVWGLVRHLKPQAQRIIELRVWLDAELAEIGRLFGFSGERVRQIIEMSLRKLREAARISLETHARETGTRYANCRSTHASHTC